MTRSHHSHHSKESTEDRYRRKQLERQHEYELFKRKHSEKNHSDDKQQKSNPNEINNSENPEKKQADKVNIKDCKTTVTSETLPLFENIPHPTEVTAGPVIIKIPVVLTEFTVSITVESLLKLDAILEIKRIRKNVFLNQCKLIPNSENGNPNTGILFLDGFIRKNIEYAAKEHNDKGVPCGKVKHTTIKVPFKCATRVTFKTPPKFKTTTPETEVEILETSIKVCDPCEESIIGRDICQQNFKTIEFFNEKVFCELISAEIVESDILEKPTNEECKSPFDRTFHHITEKVVLFLTIKLLQNQNIEISK
ncbi:MAG: CsxC family protein [Clostridiaceae bacterium]